MFPHQKPHVHHGPVVSNPIPIYPTYTYLGDSRFTAMLVHGSPQWGHTACGPRKYFSFVQCLVYANDQSVYETIKYYVRIRLVRRPQVSSRARQSCFSLFRLCKNRRMSRWAGISWRFDAV
ncbi:uncharacterized protein Ecym_7298 [Eremothecium cymbalariae DBVPG|uniref:Uncharacterized protein n=1 Tax=Eremothecium cymbalariae (strain CBS 270.75 / DBVPG 7215 / KCTC 17166 / NRRL Y-17582) TaxID=931890 RepID=G8JWC1_ERECY|nr:hypothetical protein Ecym_7298 [Eremothecium cymbalariae DBVPG\